jgi:molecular chaperone GrpE
MNTESKEHHQEQTIATPQPEPVADAHTTQGNEVATELQADQQEVLSEADQIAALELQLAEAREQMLRKVADVENYKKRLERERLQTYEFAKTDAIQKFLPVYDDLMRSIQAASTLNIEATFLNGLQMVSDKFTEVLNSYGVERIDENMVPFNYEIHEALLRQKHDDPTVQPNTVIMVLEPGYKMGEKVIRHAKVMVSE